MTTPDFLIIPHQVISDKKVSPLASNLYGYIYWFFKMKDGKCIASNETFAELLNCHKNSVPRALTILEQQEYIYVIYDEVTGNRKEIVPLVSFQKDPSPNGLGGVNQTVKGGSPNGEHSNTNELDTLTNVKVNEPFFSVKAKTISGTPSTRDGTSYSKVTHSKTTYSSLIGYCAQAQGLKVLGNYAKQMKFLKLLLDAGMDSMEIKTAIERMIKDKYWKEHQFDFANVYSNIHRYAPRTLSAEETELSEFRSLFKRNVSGDDSWKTIANSWEPGKRGRFRDFMFNPK